MRNRLRVAISDGNWSDPSIWNGNLVPEERDIVSLNGQHVVMDQDVTVFGLNNTLTTPINSYTHLTFNDEPEGIAEDSRGLSTAWYLFGNTSLYNYYGDVNANPVWISYEYPNNEAVVIQYYSFTAYSTNHSYNPTSWNFEGWDGNQWVVLDSVTRDANYYVYNGDISSNTTAYYKYRIYVFTTNNTQGMCVRYLYMYEENNYYLGSIAGGDLTISDSRTLTSTQSLDAVDTYTLLYLTADSPNTVNINADLNNGRYANTIVISGDGIYNFTGDITESINYSDDRSFAILVNSSATINFVGTVRGGGLSSVHAIMLSTNGATLNVIGDCTAGAGHNSYGVGVYSASTVNITGNLYPWVISGSTSGGGLYSNNSGANITVVGNVTGGTDGDRRGIRIDSANSLNVTGAVVTEGNRDGIHMVYTPTVSIIGPIQSNLAYGVYSGNTNYATLSGPFICGDLGRMPFLLSNVRLIPSSSVYFQFRDESLSPYTLVDPSAVVDAPLPEDVREGTAYALGTYTGTLVVPSPNQVSLGVPTDNTVGTAVLRPEDVWNAQTSAMNTDGSIGKRLKNASTVQSTGDQLSSSL